MGSRPSASVEWPIHDRRRADTDLIFPCRKALLNAFEALKVPTKKGKRKHDERRKDRLFTAAAFLLVASFLPPPCSKVSGGKEKAITIH